MESGTIVPKWAAVVVVSFLIMGGENLVAETITGAWEAKFKAGAAAIEQNDLNKGISEFEDALSLAQKLNSPNGPVVKILTTLADAKSMVGDFQSALDCISKAVELAEREFNTGSLEIA